MTPASNAWAEGRSSNPANACHVRVVASPIRRALLRIAFAFVACPAGAAALAQELRTMSSNASFEAIVSRLLRCAPTVAGIAAALGGPREPPPGDVSFALHRPPFTAVTVSEFRSEVDLTFELAPGVMTLSDVVSDPGAWSSGPRLPDSGVLEVTRTWLGATQSITCGVRLDGAGPPASLSVNGRPWCQVSRR